MHQMDWNILRVLKKKTGLETTEIKKTILYIFVYIFFTQSMFWPSRTGPLPSADGISAPNNRFCSIRRRTATIAPLSERLHPSPAAYRSRCTVTFTDPCSGVEIFHAEISLHPGQPASTAGPVPPKPSNRWRRVTHVCGCHHSLSRFLPK